MILEVSNLSVSFGNQKVLDNVSFSVERDGTLAIIGPNGAGKTVLFRAILGLIPYEGKVKWMPNIKIGYVPQKLFVAKDLPLTVLEFLKLKENSLSNIEKILGSVGIKKTDILKTRLGDLSGGEIQRVLIANALLGNPQVLLFDEPTSGVDIAGEETIYGLIERLKKEVDLTIIFISHELDIVYKHATDVLCLNKEKICFGKPHEVIDKETLAKMYGEDIKVYMHHDL
ncbi:MAG: metal ABC transporter ATP-binding protein [Patescibacteria group bacterium]